ncbi:uncharacterized protein LOC134540653 [Bacillus rossius redtenbacheri]|uniref:uncharacterized protein LOC134540653 n=1 Tax=Bacillus rossius redtenbacheri TaxID=93214 RepID=UPI002FDEB874
MRTKSFNCEVITLLVLTIIPWPGPTIFKISCPRDHASIVRTLVQKKWVPVLEKHQVRIPVECPFHPTRDIYWPQQAAKLQHRPSQWTCGLCGKSFYEERFLDLHFDNRHRDHINMAEDAVCLADYCDMMRCEVLLSQEDEAPLAAARVNTDLEVWSEAAAHRTALSLSGPRDLARVLLQGPGAQTLPPPHPARPRRRPPPRGNDTCGMVDSALPPADTQQRRLGELQRLKANCKPEELHKLKLRCEILIRDCIAGLLVNLSIQDFKDVEEELNRAVCWYLTCDRYWEDSPADARLFPWGLVFVLVMVLSLGICLCYYIIWVLFDTDDTSVASASAAGSPAHQPCYSEECYGDAAQNEHYIYVTYPPELKRRLLESCYNRTTRL